MNKEAYGASTRSSFSAVVPAAVDADDLRLKADQRKEVEAPRERLEVPEHLLVPGEPARVTGGGRVVGDEGVVEEAHGLLGKVGAERRVEARVGEVQSPEERRTVKEPRRSVASSAQNGAAVALRAWSSEALRSSLEMRFRCQPWTAERRRRAGIPSARVD